MNENPKSETILQLAGERGMVRPKDLKELNIAPVYLQRLLAKGQLVRSGRGIYLLANADFTENYSLAEACKRVPNGVVCLLSALRYHEIGSQNPSQVWMAIHPKAHRPRLDFPPVRIVRFSGPAFTDGIEEHPTTDVILRIYNVPKTIADCFRYRNKIGLDVALDALRDCWSSRRATIDELWQYAKLVKIATVMRPYLETLT